MPWRKDTALETNLLVVCVLKGHLVPQAISFVFLLQSLEMGVWDLQARKPSFEGAKSAKSHRC